MSQTVICVENISKLYRLGQVNTKSLMNDASRLWHRFRGLEDPVKLVEVSNNGHSPAYIWAVKDISFDVQKGEILGIIGENGAGKSTILKLLSRITAPTRGEIRIKGRIASLLEVGTGFHPELTGRENIFLNGALMGMRTQEIKTQFDRIVDFSGVEDYIDTPVKRYSSGMYVRLAFAVAAHLNPEILIVDEVLAVGDANFQKKCLGKMKEVSHGNGRTVLFVSHNMTAVRSLCDRALQLKHGLLAMNGNVEDVVKAYTSVSQKQSESNLNADTNDGTMTIKRLWLDGLAENNALSIDKEHELNVQFEIRQRTNELCNLSLTFHDDSDAVIFALTSTAERFEPGEYIWKAALPADFFNDISYTVDVRVVRERSIITLHLRRVLQFEGVEPPRDLGWMGKYPGLVRPRFIQWKLERINNNK